METCPCSDKANQTPPCPSKFTAAEIFEVRLIRKKMTAADEYAARLHELVGAKERLTGFDSKKGKPTVNIMNRLVCISGYCIIMGLSESSGVELKIVIVAL